MRIVDKAPNSFHIQSAAHSDEDPLFAPLIILWNINNKYPWMKESFYRQWMPLLGSVSCSTGAGGYLAFSPQKWIKKAFHSYFCAVEYYKCIFVNLFIELINTNYLFGGGFSMIDGYKYWLCEFFCAIVCTLETLGAKQEKIIQEMHRSSLSTFVTKATNHVQTSGTKKQLITNSL